MQANTYAKFKLVNIFIFSSQESKWSSLEMA